jgi:putative ABC transport system ATP-binding protein
MSSSPIIGAQHLTKSFGRGNTEVRAVDDVSLNISRGELVLIMGPSGSGKTTLLSILGGLLRPTSGEIAIDGVDITRLDEGGLAKLRAHKIGFIFQAFNLLEALNVEDNILFPAHLATGGRSAARQRADQLIETLGLAHRRRAMPDTLSGGEQQRVAIGRAMINRPLLILADEPTGNLDSEKGQEVLMILHDIARDEECAVLIVTHDPRVEEIADRILWLEDGRLRDRQPAEHAWVQDPVCGMRVDLSTAKLFAEHGGSRYVFCSQRCLDRFVETPDRFLEQASA